MCRGLHSPPPRLIFSETFFSNARCSFRVVNPGIPGPPKIRDQQRATMLSFVFQKFELARAPTPVQGTELPLSPPGSRQAVPDEVSPAPPNPIQEAKSQLRNSFYAYLVQRPTPLAHQFPVSPDVAGCSTLPAPCSHLNPISRAQ